MKRYDDKIIEWDQMSIPTTGWLCSICYENAQVDVAGYKLCVRHAKEYRLGAGKSIYEMYREYEEQRL